MKPIPQKYLEGSHEYHEGFLDCLDFIQLHTGISPGAKLEISHLVVKEVITPRYKRATA